MCLHDVAREKPMTSDEVSKSSEMTCLMLPMLTVLNEDTSVRLSHSVPRSNLVFDTAAIMFRSSLAGGMYTQPEREDVS